MSRHDWRRPIIIAASAAVGLVYLLPPVPGVNPLLPSQAAPVSDSGPLRPRPRPAPSPGGEPVIGGKVAPDGKTELTVDLPAAEKKKNVGGRDGSGLCVFTSIEYAARWQNERRLFDLQDKMRQEPGGGYPEKVDAMIAKYGPGTQYGQHTGGDESVLRAVLASGRCPCVTYDGYDPHYGQQSIAHMVTLVYLDDQWACVSDNNFPADDQFVWMGREAFLQRWRGNSGGWCVFLLNPPPPPPPKHWRYADAVR